MSKHDHLRQGGAFPGGLVNALDDLDSRITALEQSNVPKRAPQPAAEPEPAPALTIVPDEPDGPGEPQPEAAEIENPAIQSPEDQQEPGDGAQGGQS